MSRRWIRWSHLVAVAIVAAVGIAAGLGPAMRATRRDPASVLRVE